MSDLEWLNRPRFIPDRSRKLVESFWLKANDPEAPRAIWLRITMYADRREQVAETWAIWFDADGEHLAVKESHPIATVTVEHGVRAGGCTLEGGHAAGRVDNIAWDLEMRDRAGPYAHQPRWMYDNPIWPRKGMCSPRVSALFDGHLDVAGQRVEVRDWLGMQGHYWGGSHADRHAWGHCNAFEGHGPETWFDGFAARVRVGGILIPPICLGRLVVDGTPYRFDTNAHLKPADTDFSPTHWAFRLEGPDGVLVGRFEGERRNTVGITYQNPAGYPSYCLNTKLARASLRLEPRRGAALQLRGRAAALEIITRDPSHNIRMVL